MPRLLIWVGVGLILFGIILILLGFFTRFGGLPGDILVKREGFTLYLPITTSLLLSALLTGLLWFVGFLAGRGK